MTLISYYFTPVGNYTEAKHKYYLIRIIAFYMQFGLEYIFYPCKVISILALLSLMKFQEYTENTDFLNGSSKLGDVLCLLKN